MASNYVVEHTPQRQRTREIVFAGDGVRLAGQIDYPETPAPLNGRYPLIFILHHCGWNSRNDYAHYAEIGLSCGYAVFRWDKRGTGRSGAGGRGSATQDAVLAYETALEQPNVDPNQVVILAHGAGTLLLGEAFGLFARIYKPLGVILASNMLDEAAILAIDARVQVITAENDWNHWQRYAHAAAEAHTAAYDHGASFYVAKEANRNLLVEQAGQMLFHTGAGRTISRWLRDLCPAYH